MLARLSKMFPPRDQCGVIKPALYGMLVLNYFNGGPGIFLYRKEEPNAGVSLEGFDTHTTCAYKEVEPHIPLLPSASH